MAERAQAGLIGLAVMGENLALNIERNGFRLAVYNRTPERTKAFADGGAKGKNILATYSLKEFVEVIERPRRIILLVKAGQPVDEVIGELKPLLEKGDILVDGGNSWFKDTERRQAELIPNGILYIGSGVSGGEYGALWGPSLMPGGPKEAYDAIEPIWNKIAAKVEDGACCTYLGPGGAGHFVKMVHNGIEYGDMQLIAESYNLLRQGLGLSAPQLAEVFAKWNEGQLQSYLIEITAKVLAKQDSDTGTPLVDLILDKAGSKGTGKWTVQIAAELDVPIPTITAAVDSRLLSSFKDLRVKASKTLTGPSNATNAIAREEFIQAVHDALYASKICSYAQGMSLLQKASEKYEWNLRLGEIARIWKGGCIIRARFLDKIKGAYQRDPALPNLSMDPEFSQWLGQAQARWRQVVSAASQMGVPVLAMGASLAYYDSLRSERLPANLTQAQRDFFGAHTYERVDKPGSFHTEWEQSQPTK